MSKPEHNKNSAAVSNSNKSKKPSISGLMRIAAGWPVVAVVLALSFIVARCGTNESSSLDQYSLATMQAETLVLAVKHPDSDNVDLTDWLKATVFADRELDSFFITRGPRVKKVLLNANVTPPAEFSALQPTQAQTKFVVRPSEVGVAEFMLKATANASPKLLRVVIVPGAASSMGTGDSRVHLYGPTKTVKSAHALYSMWGASESVTSFSGSVGINWGGEVATYAEGLGDSTCCKSGSGGADGCLPTDEVNVCLPLPFVGEGAGEGFAFINAANKQALYSSAGRVPLPHQMFVFSSSKSVGANSQKFAVELKPSAGNSKKTYVDIYDYAYSDNTRLSKMGLVSAPSFFRAQSDSVLSNADIKVERKEGTGELRGVQISWNCPPARSDINVEGVSDPLQHKVPYCTGASSSDAQPWLTSGNTIYTPVVGYKVERCECSTSACTNECAADSTSWAVMAKAVGSEIQSLATPTSVASLPAQGIYFDTSLRAAGGSSSAGRLSYYNAQADAGESLSSSSVRRGLTADKFYRYRVVVLNQALASSNPVPGANTTPPGVAQCTGAAENEAKCFKVTGDGTQTAAVGTVVAGVAPAPAAPSGGGNIPSPPTGGGDSSSSGLSLTLQMEANPNCRGDGTDHYSPENFYIPEGCTGRMAFKLSQALDYDLAVVVNTAQGSAERRILSASTTTTTQTGAGVTPARGRGIGKSPVAGARAAEATDSGDTSGTRTERYTNEPGQEGDYEGVADHKIIISAGSVSARLPVRTFFDAEPEKREDFLLTFTPKVPAGQERIRTCVKKNGVTRDRACPSGAILENSTYVTILDRGVQLQTVSIEGPKKPGCTPSVDDDCSAPVYEGGPATFRLVLNQPARETFYVAVRTNDGTARGGMSCGTSGVDFLKRGGREGSRVGQQDQEFCVQVTKGSRGKDISIPVCVDQVSDGDESFGLEISEPPLASSCGFGADSRYYRERYAWADYISIAGRSTAMAVIKDGQAPAANLIVGFYDEAGYPVRQKSMTEPDSTGRETGANIPVSTIRVPVRLTKRLNVPLTLKYSTQDGSIYRYTRIGSARGGASKASRPDYITKSGEITFPPRSTQTQYIDLEIVGDQITEGLEKFTLSLSAEGRNCSILREADPLSQYYCYAFNRVEVSIIDANTLTLGFANKRGRLLTDLSPGGNDTPYYKVNEGGRPSRSLYVASHPSSNMTGGSADVRLRVAPRSASLGEDFEVRYTSDRQLTDWFAFADGPANNRLSFNLGGAYAFVSVPGAGGGGASSQLVGPRPQFSRISYIHINDNRRIEGDELFQVFLEARRSGGGQVQIQPGHDQGAPVLIKNNDYAGIYLQYARIEVGNDCRASTVQYKTMTSSFNMRVFQNKRLCVKAMCALPANDYLFAENQMLRLGIQAKTSGSSNFASVGNFSFAENQCLNPPLDPDSDPDAPRNEAARTTQYAYIDVGNASSLTLRIATTGAPDALPQSAIAYTNGVPEKRHHQMTGVGRLARALNRGVGWTRDTAYVRHITTVTEGSNRDYMSLAYLGYARNRACTQNLVRRPSAGVFDVPEPQDSSHHYLCFQPTFHKSGTDSFTTSGERSTAHVACNSLSNETLRLKHQAWAEPNEPVFGANIGDNSDYQALDSIGNEPSSNPYDFRLSWNTANGPICTHPTIISVAQVLKDENIADAQHRGFQFEIADKSSNRLKPAATGTNPFNAGNPYKFKILSDLEAAEEDFTTQFKVVIKSLGYTSADDCTGLAAANLNGYKPGTRLCYQAVLHARASENEAFVEMDDDSANLADYKARINQDIELILNAVGQVNNNFEAASPSASSPNEPHDFAIHTNDGTSRCSSNPTGLCGNVTIRQGFVKSDIFSIEFLQRPNPTGRTDRNVFVSVKKKADAQAFNNDQPSSLGIQGLQDFVGASQGTPGWSTQILIQNQTRHPALALVALGYANRAEDCSNEQGEFEARGEGVEDPVIAFTNNERMIRSTPNGNARGKIDTGADGGLAEGKFICLQAEYLKYQQPTSDRPCATIYSHGKNQDNGYCWAKVAPSEAPAGGFQFELADPLELTAADGTDVAAVDANDYAAQSTPLSRPWKIELKKATSKVFAVKINKNNDQRVVSKRAEVFKIALKAVAADATEQFLVDTAFSVRIPYDTTAVDQQGHDAASFDGIKVSRPFIQSANIVTLSDGSKVIQVVFRGKTKARSVTNSADAQYQIKILRPKGTDFSPRTEAQWVNQRTLKCTELVQTAEGNPRSNAGTSAFQTDEENKNKLVYISQTGAGDAMYHTYSCTLAALLTRDGESRWHVMSVVDVGSSGSSDDSMRSVSKPVQLIGLSTASVNSMRSGMQVRRVDAGGVGIQLSWPCPAADDRRWPCNAGNSPQTLSITQEHNTNSDSGDIVDYHVWRCKMRGNTKAKGNWNQLSKSSQSEPAKTYHLTDYMACEDLSDVKNIGWPHADGWINMKQAYPSYADDYYDHPNYDGYDPRKPDEKQWIEKRVWADLRFGGSYVYGSWGGSGDDYLGTLRNYADSSIDLAAAASRAAIPSSPSDPQSTSPEPKAGTEFQVAGGRIVFTDRANIEPGRYKYRVRAVAKNGTITDTYCDGVGALSDGSDDRSFGDSNTVERPNGAGGMQVKLDSSSRKCTTMTRMWASNKPRHVPLGLVAKGMPAPVLSFDPLQGEDRFNQLKLIWHGSTPLVTANYCTDLQPEEFRHVYKIQMCETDSASDTCGESDWSSTCTVDSEDSARQTTVKVADSSAFDAFSGDNFKTTKKQKSGSVCSTQTVNKSTSSVYSTNIAETSGDHQGKYKMGCLVTGLDNSKHYRFRVAEKERYQFIGVDQGFSSRWSAVASSGLPERPAPTVQDITAEPYLVTGTTGPYIKIKFKSSVPLTAEGSGHVHPFIIRSYELDSSSGAVTGNLWKPVCISGSGNTADDKAAAVMTGADADAKATAFASYGKGSSEQDKVASTNIAANNLYEFSCVTKASIRLPQRGANYLTKADFEPAKYYRFQIRVATAGQNKIDLMRGAESTSNSWVTQTAPAVRPYAVSNALVVENLKVKKNAAGKIVLSWDCPYKVYRGWSCETAASPGTGSFIDSGGYDTSSFGSGKVGYYNVDRCLIEDGVTSGLGRCAGSSGNDDQTTSATRFGVADISFKSSSVTGAPGRVEFIDSGHSDTSKDAVSNKKYTYRVRVGKSDNSGYGGDTYCRGPASLTTTDQSCDATATTGITAP